MKFYQTIKQWASGYGWLTAGLIALLLFTYFHITPNFPDPDAYYHAALAGPAVRGELIQTLPQAWFTELRFNYIDHHLFYHIILGIFTTVFGTILGLKIASAILSAAMVAVFHWLGKNLGTKHMWLLTLILLTSPAWLFRLSLIKTTAISLIVVLFGLWLAIKRRALALGALALVFVYLYGGFAILPATISVLLIVEWLVERRDKVKFTKAPWLTLVAVWIGTTIGIIFTPNFPINLKMYFSQLISIGLVNYSLVIGVGNEWYSLTLGELWLWSGAALVLFLISTPVAFLKRSQTPGRDIGLAVLSAILLIFTLKSRRYIEYFTPLSLFSSGIILQPYLQKISWSACINWFKQQTKIWQNGILLTSALTVVLGCLVTVQIWGIVHSKLEQGSPVEGFPEVYNWLRDNVPPNSLIFNASWGDWAWLYYGAPQFRYIAGLDPTFMYRAWPDLTKKYQQIANGDLTVDEFNETIRNDFKTPYLLVSNGSSKTTELIEKSTCVQKQFEDKSGVMIYKFNCFK